MSELSSAERRALKARAHRLHPLVQIGEKGLTPRVLAEIGRALEAHQLVKVRAGAAERAARAQMLERIVAEAACCAIQEIGKVFVLYRPAPPEAPPPPAPEATRSGRRESRSASRRPAPAPRPRRRRTSRSARARSAS